MPGTGGRCRRWPAAGVEYLQVDPVAGTGEDPDQDVVVHQLMFVPGMTQDVGSAARRDCEQCSVMLAR